MLADYFLLKSMLLFETIHLFCIFYFIIRNSFTQKERLYFHLK